MGKIALLHDCLVTQKDFIKFHDGTWSEFMGQLPLWLYHVFFKYSMFPYENITGSSSLLFVVMISSVHNVLISH